MQNLNFTLANEIAVINTKHKCYGSCCFEISLIIVNSCRILTVLRKKNFSSLFSIYDELPENKLMRVDNLASR